MQLSVDPAGTIPAGGQATIKHQGNGTIDVTITSDTGVKITISVPPGGATWEPPSGWESARFNAIGYTEEFRWISQPA